MNRLANGLCLPDVEPGVVAADAVAALAGVAGGSTVKVMLALALIHQATGVPYADLLNPAAVPTEGADAVRVNATEEFAFKVANHPKARAFKRDLRLQRFDVEKV